MKKNIFYILICLLLLTGCSVDYTITFDDSMKVNENIYATETDEFFAQYPKSSHERVIGFILEPNLDYLNNNEYEIKNTVYNDQHGVKISKDFNSFNDYKDISKIYSQAVQNIEYSEENGIVTVKALVNINTNEQDQERQVVNDLTLNINVPFKVISSNADKQNGNVYSWVFDKDNNNREIEISFKKDYIKKEYIIYIVIGAILVITLFTYLIIKNKASRNNEI